MDIDFYIDTNGIASGFNLNFFNDLDIVENTRMQSELYNEAILNLKKTKRWQSGTIKGKKVFASTSARIFFRASKSKFAK
jgi:hypothetical protein